MLRDKVNLRKYILKYFKCLKRKEKMLIKVKGMFKKNLNEIVYGRW